MFGNVFTSSFVNLNSLKLKSCMLTSAFFNNVGSMDFCKNLTHLNFSGCIIDLEGFKTFLVQAQLVNLRTLNLSSTNIDDSVCSLIAVQTSIGEP